MTLFVKISSREMLKKKFAKINSLKVAKYVGMFRLDCSCSIMFIFTNAKPRISRIPNNQNIPNTPLWCLSVCFSEMKGRKEPVNSSSLD